MKLSIRLRYLYLFSFVGLMLVVFGTVQLIDLGLKIYVFKQADQELRYPAPPRVALEGEPVKEIEEEQMKDFQAKELVSRRQREASTAISMIAVGVPVYLYHWKVIQKRKE